MHLRALVTVDFWVFHIASCCKARFLTTIINFCWRFAHTSKYWKTLTTAIVENWVTLWYKKKRLWLLSKLKNATWSSSIDEQSQRRRRDKQAGNNGEKATFRFARFYCLTAASGALQAVSSDSESHSHSCWKKDTVNKNSLIFVSVKACQTYNGNVSKRNPHSKALP